MNLLIGRNHSSENKNSKNISNFSSFDYLFLVPMTAFFCLGKGLEIACMLLSGTLALLYPRLLVCTSCSGMSILVGSSLLFPPPIVIYIFKFII